MDKQALKKHHFWILLVLAIILIPIALSGAVFGVGGLAEEKAKKIDSDLKALKSQQPKGNHYREALGEQKEELQKQKSRVWEAAYKAQDGLIRWPKALNHLNDLADKGQLFFGDPLPSEDLALFRRDDVYMTEYNTLPGIIAPTEFADKNWKEVLRYVSKWQNDPSSEEMWLAQEDFCVEREVLHDIHQVNQMIAEFLPDPQPPTVPSKPKGKAAEELKRYQDEMARYAAENAKYLEKKRVIDDELKAAHKVQANEFAGRFISPYWRLDLVVGRANQGRAGELAFRGKLTNTGTRRQNVARIEFKVWMMDPNRGPTVQSVLLPLQKDFLEADKSFDFAETRVGDSDSTLKIYKVEQKLDARSVPVKQLAQLKLGYVSHRFADKEMKRSAFSEDEVKKAPPPPPNANPGLPGAPGAGAANMDFTSNGVERMRYLQVNEQVRRMPVGIVLIVDQGHVQDVIRALANSRLRFQNTQVHYERFRGVISLDDPVVGDGLAPLGDGGNRRLPGVGGGDVGRGGQRGPGRGNRGFGTPPGDHNANPAGEEEGSSNLVEMTIYGLISLYERYPPKAAAGQAPPAGATPPATPPGAPPPPAAVPVPPAAGQPGNLPPPGPLGSNPTATTPKPPGQ